MKIKIPAQIIKKGYISQNLDNLHNKNNIKNATVLNYKAMISLKSLMQRKRYVI